MVYIDVIPGAVGCFTSFYAIPCKYIPVKVHFGDNVRIELLYLYVFVCICMYLYVFVCICMYLYVFVCICMYLYVFVLSVSF